MTPGEAPLELVINLAAKMLSPGTLSSVKEEEWKNVVFQARRLIRWAAENLKVNPGDIIPGSTLDRLSETQLEEVVEGELALIRDWTVEKPDGATLEEAHSRHADLPFLTGRFKTFPSFLRALENAGVPVKLLQSLNDGLKANLDKLREADERARQQHRKTDSAARRARRAKARVGKEKASSPPSKQKAKKALQPRGDLK